MSNISKIIFYYEPGNKKKYTSSFTLSFSRINEETDTYKQKVILQHWSEKRNQLEEYKMKEVHFGAKQLIEKIQKIDFTKQYESPKSGEEMLFISYGDKKIYTGDMDAVKEVLDLFQLLELADITHRHYEYIKDMYEYIALKKLMINKSSTLSAGKRECLNDIFRNYNPYKTFQSISYLDDYLDFVISKA